MYIHTTEKGSKRTMYRRSRRIPCDASWKIKVSSVHCSVGEQADELQNTNAKELLVQQYVGTYRKNEHKCKTRAYIIIIMYI